MGYEVVRFEGEVDEELICPICSGVLEEPLQAPMCEHSFCQACIHEWLSRQPSCPIDRESVTSAQLKPPPRILRNLLARLNIMCDNAPHGCNAVMRLETLQNHLTECQFNPKRPVPCEDGCGLVVPKDEIKDHNCVRELRVIVQSQQLKFSEFAKELGDLRFQVREQRREIQLLNDLLRAFRSANPTTRAIAEQIERNEVLRWIHSMSRARVTRWGGMISTPDAILQNMVKTTLGETGCPQHLLDALMDNSHERNWPPSLSSLETRQANRRMYETYTCRRVPGKQAVVVLPCDNPHISIEMMVEPGLVMIFAHGVE